MTERLDVDRLTLAVAEAFDHQPPWWDVKVGPDDLDAAHRTFTWAADRIAAAYEQMSAKPTDGERGGPPYENRFLRLGQFIDDIPENEGPNHYEPTNDLSANVKLVDAVLTAAKRAGLILVDEASGITIPDANETIRRYLAQDVL